MATLNLNQALSSGGLTVQPQVPKGAPNASQYKGSTPPPGATNYVAPAVNTSQPVAQQSAQVQGPSQSDIDSAISDIYNSSNNYLNQAEAQVNSDYPTVQQDINSQYNDSKNQLDTANTANLAQFGQQTDQANYAHESALAAARRLYSELRQGYQQRFGGATSAGDASSEIANVEQQRQEGQQNRGYQDTLTTINNKKDDTVAQYNNGLQSLLTQKQTSLNQAQRDFQNKLLQISQSRAANEQAKGQARLGALQDLRNQVFQINQQTTQFQQELQAQAQQNSGAVSAYSNSAGSNVQGGSGAVSSYGSQITPTSNLQVGGQQAQAQPSYTGAISSNTKYDQYGNPIA